MVHFSFFENFQNYGIPRRDCLINVKAGTKTTPNFPGSHNIVTLPTGMNCRKMIRLMCFLGTLLVAGNNNLFGQAVTNTRDFVGTYKATLPCKDCDKINSTLELTAQTDSSGTFTVRDQYVARGKKIIMAGSSGEWIARGVNYKGKKSTLLTFNEDEPDKLKLFLLRDDGHLVGVDSELTPAECAIDCTYIKTLADE